MMYSVRQQKGPHPSTVWVLVATRLDARSCDSRAAVDRSKQSPRALGAHVVEESTTSGVHFKGAYRSLHPSTFSDRSVKFEGSRTTGWLPVQEARPDLKLFSTLAAT